MEHLSQSKSIVCFGEVLWDVLPTHKVAGGAPMNVAFHANNFGMQAQMISAVGKDALGVELIDFLAQKNIPTSLITIHDAYPTSTVQVTLNENGSASYEIVQPVAWDFLESDETCVQAVAAADLFLFGSLVCRSKNNLQTILQLIENAKKTVFDVNLRPPFFNQRVIETLLQKADIVKVNDEELVQIIDWYNFKGSIQEQMMFVSEKFEIETMVMTAGKDGAYCLHDQVLYSQDSFQVTVQDTIGSGDSFLAAFLFKMSSGFSWQECLAFACATGALVATKSGGTPPINEKLVEAFKNTYPH